MFLNNPPANPLMSFLLPVLIFVVFFFFILRPQIKRQREQQKFAENIKEGMEVVTSSGIVGKVVKLEGNVARLLVDEKTYMRVLRNTIVQEYKAS
ncbi:MAG: preprotein translocase subunit YajC [Chitinophagales bacterium]|nr:preprotein translocase subunit YajC [Chitinophagales bacterium]